MTMMRTNSCSLSQHKKKKKIQQRGMMGYDQICTFSFETGWMANTCNSKFPHQRQCKLVNITEKTWWDLGFIHVQFDGRGKEEAHDLPHV